MNYIKCLFCTALICLMFCSCNSNNTDSKQEINHSDSTVLSTFLTPIDELRNKSARELGISDSIKFYIDNFALTDDSFDVETNGYVLNCIGCTFWSENEEQLSLSSIIKGAGVYQQNGVKITGLYVEIPITESADISILNNLVSIECISNNISGLNCTKELKCMKSFVLRYVQGQSEESLLNVCKIIEYCNNIDKIVIEGIYTDEYPNLVSYIKGMYDIEVYDEGIIFEKINE